MIALSKRLQIIIVSILTSSVLLVYLLFPRISANTVLKHVSVFRKPMCGCFTVSSCTIYFYKLLEKSSSSDEAAVKQL